jgi:hypothetical protein
MCPLRGGTLFGMGDQGRAGFRMIRAERSLQVFCGGSKGGVGFIGLPLCLECAPEGQISSANIHRKCAWVGRALQQVQSTFGISSGLVRFVEFEFYCRPAKKKNWQQSSALPSGLDGGFVCGYSFVRQLASFFEIIIR